MKKTVAVVRGMVKNKCFLSFSFLVNAFDGCKLMDSMPGCF